MVSLAATLCREACVSVEKDERHHTNSVERTLVCIEISRSDTNEGDEAEVK